MASVWSMGRRVAGKGAGRAVNAIPMPPGPAVTRRTRNATGRTTRPRRKKTPRYDSMDYRLRAQRAQRTRAAQAKAVRPARTAKINQIRRASATGRTQPGQNPSRTPYKFAQNGKNQARKVTGFRKGLAFGALGGAALMGMARSNTGSGTSRTTYADSRGIYGY